jgi:hypothetical protein
METTAGTVESGCTPIFDELVGRFGIELPAEPTPVPPTTEPATVDEAATA